MSPASVLEQLETLAHLTMAETSRTRSIFRQPRSPHNIARAWRLIANVRATVAFAESDLLQRIDDRTLAVVVMVLQASYDKVRAFVTRGIEAGLGQQDWHRALAEAMEALDDGLEGFYLARDAEFRAMVDEAVQGLRSTPPDQVSGDWRSALAAIPD